MTVVRIRKAKRDDLDDLAETARLSWHSAYDGVLAPEAVAEGARRLVEDVKSNWSSVYVAESSDRVVGFFDFQSGTSHIQHIYVHPDFHRRGIGRLMIEAAIDVLRDQGFDRASIEVIEGTSAPEFQRALGWRETGRETNSEGVLVISMSKDL